MVVGQAAVGEHLLIGGENLRKACEVNPARRRCRDTGSPIVGRDRSALELADKGQHPIRRAARNGAVRPGRADTGDRFAYRQALANAAETSALVRAFLPQCLDDLGQRRNSIAQYAPAPAEPHKMVLNLARRRIDDELRSLHNLSFLAARSATSLYHQTHAFDANAAAAVSDRRHC